MDVQSHLHACRLSLWECPFLIDRSGSEPAPPRSCSPAKWQIASTAGSPGSFDWQFGSYLSLSNVWNGLWKRLSSLLKSSFAVGSGPAQRGEWPHALWSPIVVLCVWALHLWLQRLCFPAPFRCVHVTPSAFISAAETSLLLSLMVSCSYKAVLHTCNSVKLSLIIQFGLVCSKSAWESQPTLTACPH